MEDKYTLERGGQPAKSFTITDKLWLKIAAEAAMTPPGLRPRMRITIPGIPKLCVMLEDDYIDLVGRASVDPD